MNMKKLLHIAFACAITMGCLCIPVNAQNEVDRQILNLEEMDCEQVETVSMGTLDEKVIVRSTNSINATVVGYSHSISRQTVYLVERGIISINCSYSPSSASVDFVGEQEGTEKSASQRTSRRLAFMTRRMREASAFAVSSILEKIRSRPAGLM